MTGNTVDSASSIYSSGFKPRLNPFSFPSDTSLYFGLLIVFMLCGSISLYGDLLSAINPFYDKQGLTCASGLIETQFSKLHLLNADNYLNYADEPKNSILPQIARCSEMSRPKVAWEIAGAIATLLLAVAIFRFFPGWKLRRERLIPITAENLMGVLDELECLRQKSGLSHPIRFVWNPLMTSVPLAFGCSGNYIVALSGGFIASYFYTDRAAFRAIILHELAHVRNGDVDKAYFTIAVWLAFLATGLAPSATLLVWPSISQSLRLDTLLDIVLLTPAIVFSGLGVLRTREFYADVRASVWDQTPINLDRVLSALPPTKVGYYLRLLQFHPEALLRRQTLEDPYRLFQLSFWNACGIGIAAWFVIESLRSIATAYIPHHVQSFVGWYLAINTGIPLIVMALAIGVIGIGVWRGAFATLMKGQGEFPSAGWQGAALALGYMANVGPKELFYYLDSINDKTSSIPGEFWSYRLASSVSLALIFLVSCFLIVKWIKYSVVAWFKVVSNSGSPYPTLITTVMLSAVFVAGCYGAGVFVTDFFFFTPMAELPNRIYIYSQTVGLPLFLFTVLAWVFPLAAWFRIRRGVPSGCAPWIFLDSLPHEVPDYPHVRPHQALMIGIVMGLIFFLVLEAIYLRTFLPFEFARTIQAAFQLTEQMAQDRFGDKGYAIVIFATTLQALTAAIVAISAKQLEIIQGLFAATVAGIVMAIGDYIFYFSVGNVQSLRETLLVSVTFLGQGAIFAVPTAIAAAQLGQFTRRFTLVMKPVRQKTDNIQSKMPNMSETDSLSLVVRLLPLKYLISLFFTVAVSGEVFIVQLRQQHNNIKSTNQGYAQPQITLGQTNLQDRDVTQNDNQAVLVLQKAAEQGDAAAQSNLGVMYVLGRGVMQDDVLAVQWFRRAAEQGYAAAQNNLGRMYALGRGVAQDYDHAVHWFRKASEQGYTEAQQRLHDICMQGIRQACS
jgi:hypothetical protein